MLKTEDIDFLQQNPPARRLLYRSAHVDAIRAHEFLRFLREAYMRHFPVTLSVEVEGVSMSMNIVFDKDGPGWDLYNYLAPWVASMALKDNVIVDQMAKIWPDLPGWWEEEAKNSGQPITPQAP